MKTTIIKLFAICLLFATMGAVTSCKKGEDDPGFSLRSRKARFVNEWTLVKYEKNGVQQSLDNTTFIYDTHKDETLKETTEGVIFGATTRTVRSGTWTFVSDKEDVKITVDSSETRYEIQRLANKELWLKHIDGADTYILYFEGK